RIVRAFAIERAELGEPDAATVLGKAAAVPFAVAKVQVDPRVATERNACAARVDVQIEFASECVAAILKAGNTERKTDSLGSGGHAAVDAPIVVPAETPAYFAIRRAGPAAARHDVDHAAHRVSTVHRRGGAAQHFDPFDIARVEVGQIVAA